MLRKPGEVDSRFRAQSSARRKAQESPDVIVRKLQRNQGNRECADCSAKLPQAVNLTHGTFVCHTCSGVHREFNHRIKGIGHSSFTQEEADFLSSHGNDEVNSLFMAKYSSHSERLKAPDGSTHQVDGQLMRVWIRRKYLDKAWASKDITLSAKKTPAASDVIPQPTKAKIPPKKAKIPSKKAATKATPTQPTNDLFGGWDDIVPATTTVTASAADDAEWDAFGESRNNATSNTNEDPFQADFSSLNQQSQHKPVFEAQFSTNATPSQPVQQSSFPTTFPHINSPQHVPNGNGAATFDPTFGTPFTQSQEQPVPSTNIPLTPSSKQSQQHISSNLNADSVSAIDQEQKSTEASTSIIHSHQELSKADVAQVHGSNLAVDTPNNVDQVHTDPSVMTATRDSFDAFAGLSLNTEPAVQTEMNKSIHKKQKTMPKYSTGQIVQYKNSLNAIENVQIVEVHLDDDLVPFYTIKMRDGREKQTDDGHLLLQSENESEGMQKSKEEQVQSIVNMLHTLTDEQLMAAKQFIAKMTL